MTRRMTIHLSIGAPVAIAGVLLLAAALTAAGRNSSPVAKPLAGDAASGPGRANILFICVDTLRADHVGLYGYARATTPHVDAFFGTARVFETAYATAPITTPSVVSALTGLYPHRHGVRLLMQRIAPEVGTVVDDLRRAGYQTAAVVSNAVLADEACGLGERFDFYDDDVEEREPFREEMFERRAARTTDAAIRWLVEDRRVDRPHFLWVHYIDPHGPYRPPADKPVDFSHEAPVPIDADRVPDYSREPGLADGQEYVDRYDEEIAYTDREVGRLLETYGALGLAQSAAVIFFSDHGESMLEHEHWFRHQMNVYEEMVRIPLAIRFHRLARGRVSVPVSNADLAPTVLDLAALPVPAGLDGRSLLGDIEPRDIFCEGRADGGGLWRGLVRGRHKATARHGMSNVIRAARSFDLTADPGELHPISLEPDDPAWVMLAELIAADPDPGGVPESYQEGELPGPGVARPSSPEMVQRLRSLGYVGSD